MKKNGAFKVRLSANGWVARIFIGALTLAGVGIMCFALMGRLPEASKLRRARLDVGRLQNEVTILETRDLPVARARAEEMGAKTGKLIFSEASEIEAWIGELESRFAAPGWRLQARWDAEEGEEGPLALAKFPAMLGTTNLLQPINIRFELSREAESQNVSGAAGYRAYVGLTRALLDDPKLKRFSGSEAHSDGVRFREATLNFHVLEGAL